MDVTDIINKKFGKIIVLSYNGYVQTGVKVIKKQHSYNIKCDCGIEKIMYRQAIVASKSCGCGKITGIIKFNKSKRLPDNQSLWRHFFNIHQRSCKARNIINEINLQEFKRIVIQNCYYCGIEPKEKKFSNLYGSIFINGIDRIDNDIGYTILNLRPCCEYCNRMKLNKSEEEFFNKITLIYKKHIDGNK